MLWEVSSFCLLTVENWSIDKNIFKLYDSYGSPVIPRKRKEPLLCIKIQSLFFTVCVLLLVTIYSVKKFVIDGDSLILPSQNKKEKALEQGKPLTSDSSRIWLEAYSPDGRNVFILYNDSTKERHILNNFPVNQLVKNEGLKMKRGIFFYVFLFCGVVFSEVPSSAHSKPPLPILQDGGGGSSVPLFLVNLFRLKNIYFSKKENSLCFSCC